MIINRYAAARAAARSSVAIAQAKQMDGDALAILNKGPLLVPGELALRDVRIIEAAFKSAANGARILL